MGTYRTFGPLGLIVLMFGLLAGLFSGSWTSFYVLAHLILGGMMLALYLFTHIDNLKESVGGRQAKFGTNAAVYTVLTLAVIAAVNYIAAQRSWRIDLTEQGVFSLAPQTTSLLEGLDVDVVARGFYRQAEEGAARDLLDTFATVSDRFDYELIDPDKRPEMAERYEITQYGTVHLTAGDQDARVTEVTEESLTNTLIRLTAARRHTVYYTSGHGEPDPEDTSDIGAFGLAAAALDNEGYDLEPIVLASVADVPADADLLIVAGPDRPFLEREVETLDRYLTRGGEALILVDPQSASDLTPLLTARGIDVGDDVIIEQVVQLFAGASLGVEPVVADYGTHPITAGFGQRTIYQLARSIVPSESAPEGIDVQEIARTSDSSWAETNVDLIFDTGEVNLDEEDTAGPISIGVAATLSPEALTWTPPAIASARADAGEPTAPEDLSAPADLEGRIVVFGDSEWVRNRYLNNFYNQDLFLNAIGWLVGEEELISIRPRGTRASRVMLTAGESQAVFYLTVLLLPELILFGGMMLWLGRRYR